MNKNQPLISIIMPVYNCEKYVLEAIESVCNQSYNNWELLVVNDGSTDNTSKIIERKSKEDARIKIYNKQNEGVSMARNFALNNISGDYVTFIDSDDVYHVERLARIVKVLNQSSNCDIIFSKHQEFIGELNINEIICTKKIEISNDNILKNIISDSNKHFVWNAMIKSSIAKNESFSSIRFAEDFCYIRDCILHCKQIAIMDDILYFYRKDNENAMTKHFLSEKYVPDYMKLVEITYDFCRKHELDDDFYRKMVAHEYAQNSMRIRKSTSYSNFVRCMNDINFREGIKFANSSQCNLFEKILFNMVKYKIYIPFSFWIW